jgi:hypothetical protein
MLMIFQESEINFDIDDKGRVWFLAQNVVSQLGLSVSHTGQFMDRHVFADYKQKRVLGEGRPAWYIAEPGVYQLAFRADTDNARNFQHWVFENVLPSIRARGEYIQNQDKHISTADDSEISLNDDYIASNKVICSFIKDCLVFTNNEDDTVTNSELQEYFKNWCNSMEIKHTDNQIIKISQYIRKKARIPSNKIKWTLCPEKGKEQKVRRGDKYIKGLKGIRINPEYLSPSDNF